MSFADFLIVRAGWPASGTYCTASRRRVSALRKAIPLLRDDVFGSYCSNSSKVTTMATSKAAGQRFASVWDAIEDSREVAASLRLRAEVANAIIEEAGRRRLTQARVADLCGVTQPRISDLMRGRLDLFSLDGLIDMAAQLGLRTRLTVSRSKAA
jgi:predicted XRE-type DNA-binding protein